MSRPGLPSRRGPSAQRLTEDAAIRALAGTLPTVAAPLLRACGLALGLFRPARGESVAAARALCLAAIAERVGQ